MRCPNCNSHGGWMPGWKYCIDCGHGRAEVTKPVDPDAGAKAAYAAWCNENGLYVKWERMVEPGKVKWRAVAEAVRRADREGR